MMKKNAFKLLAVVTLAAAAPAVAGPQHDPWAHTKNIEMPPNLPEQVRAMQGDALLAGVLATFGVTIPRQLGNGSPACGNVQSKVPPSQRTGCEEVRTASNDKEQQ